MHGFLLLVAAIWVAFGMPVVVVYAVRLIFKLAGRLRTWVILAILAGAIWLAWAAERDNQAQKPFTAPATDTLIP